MSVPPAAATTIIPRQRPTAAAADTTSTGRTYPLSQRRFLPGDTQASHSTISFAWLGLPHTTQTVSKLLWGLGCFTSAVRSGGPTMSSVLSLKREVRRSGPYRSVFHRMISRKSSPSWEATLTGVSFSRATNTRLFGMVAARTQVRLPRRRWWVDFRRKAHHSSATRSRWSVIL
jgi:hypothetical protein